MFKFLKKIYKEVLTFIFFLSVALFVVGILVFKILERVFKEILSFILFILFLLFIAPILWIYFKVILSDKLANLLSFFSKRGAAWTSLTEVMVLNSKDIKYIHFLLEILFEKLEVKIVRNLSKIDFISESIRSDISNDKDIQDSLKGILLKDLESLIGDYKDNYLNNGYSYINSGADLEKILSFSDFKKEMLNSKVNGKKYISDMRKIAQSKAFEISKIEIFLEKYYPGISVEIRYLPKSGKPKRKFSLFDKVKILRPEMA